MTAIGATGDVTCAQDSTAPTGTASGDLSGIYPGPLIAPNAVTGDIIVPSITSGTVPDGLVMQPYIVGADGDVVRILCTATNVDIALTGSYQIAFHRIR